MNREEIIQHIIKVVRESQAHNRNDQKQTGNEIINLVYATIKPYAARSARSELRKKILSGDYFGEQLIFFLELLDQCGLEVSRK